MCVLGRVQQQPGLGKFHKSVHSRLHVLTRNECLLPFQLAFVCVTGASPSPHLPHCLQDGTTGIVTLNYTDKPSNLVPSLQSYPTPAAADLTLLLIDNDGTAPPRGTDFLRKRGPPPFLPCLVTDFHPASHTWECCMFRRSAVTFWEDRAVSDTKMF